MTYVGIGHRVEWTNRQRILVHNEKVSLVLFFYNITKFLFVHRAQVLIVILFKMKIMCIICE